jgi:hypothetical protein
MLGVARLAGRAADPANRHVAGELETRWNKALARVAEIEAKVAAHNAVTPPRELTPTAFETLAGDLKAVSTSPMADARLKKRIVRTVIREVIADIDAEAAEIVLIVHWMGGVHTELRLPRRRKGQRNSTASDVIAAVRNLVLIANDDLIAVSVQCGFQLPTIPAGGGVRDRGDFLNRMNRL